MANEKDDVDVLVRIVLKHQRTIDAVLGAITDHACLIEKGLERCCGNDCAEPATVRHVDLDVRMCDSHCARAIVRAQKVLNEPATGAVAHIRVRLADEGCWIDLEDAPRIRRIKDYVEMVKRDFDAGPPEHQDQLN